MKPSCFGNFIFHEFKVADLHDRGSGVDIVAINYSLTSLVMWRKSISVSVNLFDSRFVFEDPDNVICSSVSFISMISNPHIHDGYP